MSKRRLTDLKQSGMVAIFVTLIMMFVISLTVIGFAQVMRRSQREALDKQLSTQAFYAAESGINAARNLIASTGTTALKTSCGPSGPYSSLTGVVDPTNKISYSCLLIDDAPLSLQYNLSAANASKVFPITSSSTMRKVHLTWTPQPGWTFPTAPGVTCPAQGQSADYLPPAYCWPTPFPMLRIDLVPTSTGQLDRDSLMKNTMTAFLTPNTNSDGIVNYTGSGDAGASNIDGGLANQGAHIDADCLDGDNLCHATITGLNSTNYYMRVSILYDTSTTLTVSAEDASRNPVPLTGTQLVIDATGKAQDVLRRIQVHIPLVGDGIHSDYGLETVDDICKAFTTFPGYNNSGCVGSTSPSTPPANGNTLGGDFIEGDQSDKGKGPKNCTGQCIYYNAKFTITKSPATGGAIVNSCTWNWGDGTTATYSGSRCDVGTVEEYFYSKSTPACTPFIVTLVFHTNQGDVPTINKKIITPSGQDSGC